MAGRRQSQTTSSGANRTARRHSAAAKGAGADPNQPLPRRARLFRRVMQLGPLRGFYARRLLRFLDKSKKKGRPIPNQLTDLDDYLSRVPPKQRRAVLEASLSGELDSRAGRDLRRAAGRQNRQKGRASGGQRPGLPPVPGARPRPK
jgi:hypothetical protein